MNELRHTRMRGFDLRHGKLLRRCQSWRPASLGHAHQLDFLLVLLVLLVAHQLDFLLVLLVLLLNSYKRETATAFVLFGHRPP